jgi:putative ABC transport system ATP-binding protein
MSLSSPLSAPYDDRMPHAVKVSNLHKSYHQGSAGGRLVPALRGIDLIVEEGEFLAIMGASGSGKSTLLHLCAALDRFDSGSIEVAGQRLETLNESQLTLFRRRRIGIVFQQFNLIPTLTAFENIALPVQLDGGDIQSHTARIRELLQILKIDHRADHRPDALSGGEQQRVAIARALVLQPPVLFADEPTGNLDSHSAEQFWTLLDQAAQNSRSTVIMVTHEPSAARHAHRVLVLRDGQVSGEFSPDSFEDPGALAAHYHAIAR